MLLRLALVAQLPVLPAGALAATVQNLRRNGHEVFAVIDAAFAQRRKTLRNALLRVREAEVVDRALALSSIDGKRRGETLSVEEFADLARSVDSASRAARPG